MSSTKPAGKGPKSSTPEETYEPDAFAKKFGMPIGEAKTIIKRYGPSRRKIDAHMAARDA
ncbi:hypothetical protein ASG43_21800 [Aureimonas sp. Leaf454]|uniref:DUF3606 domain-containing protein n=1 Tax=Aureimonas sp. Leaf454 TaxID=1736381 RepID=UPI0006FD25D6|nr:DUF3606 domain-containing protein [Aureimonas sp. Leaf454]KQT50192.1 hypothetical protein ASG43_21800 [Aureimonas sp. Leaf454]